MHQMYGVRTTDSDSTINIECLRVTIKETKSIAKVYW